MIALNVLVVLITSTIETKKKNSEKVDITFMYVFKSKHKKKLL